MRRKAGLALLSLLSALCLGAADGPRFEAVSIHPSPDNAPFFARPPSNGKFSATGIVARLIVMLAYNVQESQIANGPAWLGTERWNVDAKSEAGRAYSIEETQQMLQNLLEDRFGMQAHRETRELPAYVLKIAKDGPKLKADDTGATNVRISGNSIGLERGEISRLTQLLSSALGKPVVDQTGLSGHYDVSLQWNDAPVPDGGVIGVDAHATPDPNRESIFTAIQDQLGLQLVSQHAPVEMIVIDKIERPSPN
ncbi:MAG TPA: TIGR03435 family protein [Bryobacteraceae bacterium]|nr:TIGR03435 family protein [Bryobacteraceae bacterium]